MIEIEAKFKIDDLDAIRERLRRLSAERLGLAREDNVYFDRPDGSLTAADCGLRLRVTQDGAILCYKGPRQPGPFKRREEVELRVDDPAAAGEMLSKLGFEPSIRFAKTRESWRLNDCSIELDDVPELGRYIEIEGPDEDAIEQARRALALENASPISDPYVVLIARNRAKKGKGKMPGNLPCVTDLPGGWNGNKKNNNIGDP